MCIRDSVGSEMCIRDRYDGMNDEGEDVETVEIGLDGAPSVPFEMLSGMVQSDVEGETGKPYRAELSWLEPKSEYEVTSLSVLTSGKYSAHSVSLGGFDTKEEAVAYVKEQIATRMPRDIKFMRTGKSVPTEVAQKASGNGYTITTQRVRRSGSQVGEGYPVVSFTSKATAGEETSRTGYISALTDGTYRSVVRWDDGARSKPAYSIFNTAEEAYAHAFGLLSEAPSANFGQ
jgi:hypothetical protein